MGGALAPGLRAAARPAGYLVEDLIHMFADDPLRFPFHPNATYHPQPVPVKNYVAFVREAKLDHTVLVQSEVYKVLGFESDAAPEFGAVVHLAAGYDGPDLADVVDVIERVCIE